MNAIRHKQRNAAKTLDAWKAELLGVDEVVGVSGSASSNNNSDSGSGSGSDAKGSGSSAPKPKSDAPSHVICPLTHDIFEDPVITPYGMLQNFSSLLFSLPLSSLSPFICTYFSPVFLFV